MQCLSVHINGAVTVFLRSNEKQTPAPCAYSWAGRINTGCPKRLPGVVCWTCCPSWVIKTEWLGIPNADAKALWRCVKLNSLQQKKGGKRICLLRLLSPAHHGFTTVFLKQRLWQISLLLLTPSTPMHWEYHHYLKYHPFSHHKYNEESLQLRSWLGCFGHKGFLISIPTAISIVHTLPCTYARLQLSAGTWHRSFFGSSQAEASVLKSDRFALNSGSAVYWVASINCLISLVKWTLSTWHRCWGNLMGCTR